MKVIKKGELAIREDGILMMSDWHIDAEGLEMDEVINEIIKRYRPDFEIEGQTFKMPKTWKTTKCPKCGEIFYVPIFVEEE